MSFVDWMTSAEFARWRKALREDYARIRQHTKRPVSAIGYGLCDSEDWGPPLSEETTT